MDSLQLCQTSAALLEEIQKSRVERQRLLEAVRAERERSRRLREEAEARRERSLGHLWGLWAGNSIGRVPDRIPLEWTEPVALEIALRDALRSTQECAVACLEIVPLLPLGIRGRVATVFGAASLAAERLEDEGGDRAAALALCVRIIDSNMRALNQAGRMREGLSAAVAARRCADRCRQALAALYLSEEELP